MGNSNCDKIIIGIDPGSNITGYAIIEINTTTNKVNLITMGTIFLKKKETYEKLAVIYEEIEKILHQYKPDVFCIETPFYGKNIQSLLKLGRAQGVAIACAAMRRIPIFEYSPRRIKQLISGLGSSNKTTISTILGKQFGLDESEIKLDATDALSIALCHHYLNHSSIRTFSPIKKKRKKASSRTLWSKFLSTKVGESKIK